MRKTTITITVLHLFTSSSTLSAESKSHIIALRFEVYETLQINQSNFLILNNSFIKGYKKRIITFPLFHNKSFRERQI